MNHDATHCADYKKSCPESCYRAQLTEELKRIHYGLPVSWSHFKGTKECPKEKGGKSDRDRLIELIQKAGKHQCLDAVCGDIDSLIDSPRGAEFTADHLLANGVIVPPCKVGDIVWSRKVEPYKVISIEWFSRKVTHLHCVSPVTNIRSTFAVGKRSLGKTVFLTREAAEQALQKGGESDA